MLEIYSYNTSFIIELILCEKCGVYYSKVSEPDHTCNKDAHEEIDIMQTISDNLSKNKSTKEKKK